MDIKKNDLVAVLSGDEKGKQGKVLNVSPKTNLLLIEGIRFIKRHSKPTTKNQKGGIVEKEAPISAAKVSLICPKCNQKTKIRRKKLENKKSVRICGQCQEMIE